MAHREPVILDALLAIAVLHEHPQYMKSCLTGEDCDYPTPRDHPALSGNPIDKFHAQALRHYNRSIRTLRAVADPANVSSSVALLSCALFTCIEVLRDDVFAALALLENGVMLVKRFSICSGDLDDDVLSTVKGMFSRMGLVTALFGQSQPVNALIDDPMPKNGKLAFSSLYEARTALCRLMSGMPSTPLNH
jgi:hypothetical protein